MSHDHAKEGAYLTPKECVMAGGHHWTGWDRDAKRLGHCTSCGTPQTIVHGDPSEP